LESKHSRLALANIGENVILGLNERADVRAIERLRNHAEARRVKED
jgi:hypothetical protein